MDDGLEDSALFVMASLIAQGARDAYGRRLETSRFKGGGNVT
jgi:hypothetical protein